MKRTKEKKDLLTFDTCWLDTCWYFDRHTEAHRETETQREAQRHTHRDKDKGDFDKKKNLN